MADSNFKPSFGVETLLSGDLAVESEKFLLFMKAYYEWMQTTKIEITSTVGTFIKGETIISASGATAVIREVAVGELIVQVDTRKPFNLLEGITGQTSLATANISLVKDNVVRKTGKILEYRNLETSIDQYVDYLRDELYPSIPVTYYGDKRAVASRFKELFISKSNEDSYRFLFKLLYNDNIDFYYPGTDVLRISDGNFEKTQIIRTIATATGTNALGNPFDRDIFLFLNKTIRGQSSGFLANVVDIKKFFIGSREVAEMTLKLVSGTFTAGEDVVDIDDDNLVTTIYGIISGVTIVDGGSGYEDGDVITITGNGSEAQAKVSSIKESPISALTVNTIGHGYQLNTAATINNTGTGGSGFIVQVTALANTYSVTSGANTYTVGEVSQVSIINRGEGYFKKPSITLQDTTISSLGLLSDKLITISNAGSNYGVGNTLVFTGGAGANAAGQIASVVETTTYDLLFEDGQRMLADGSYYDIIKNQDWAVKGPIKRIELTNFGTGYSSANLPSITISTTTGSSANLVATNIQGKNATVTVDTSNNITGIGSIRAVEIVNFGINYSAANASASAVGDGNAILSPVISGLGIKQGVWLDDDGKVDYKIIQDSYYYQDYSYVIKSGLTFQTYSDTLKQILHPAGLIYFGEIQILNDLNVAAELINDEQISRMLVQLLAQIYVGGEYEYSHINWTLKVDPPILRLDTDLLDVQEYVIHLVPEGDEETGITDVGVAINQGDVRHSFIIQTPFELDVTSTSATLPTTKFVVSKFDILPGYGQNTYGDLPLTPNGVYGDYWAGTPISVLQDVRFGDLYYENPAYQSILNLFIDNTVDVSTLSTTSRLKYETFAVNGIIPLAQSIITIPQPVIIRPEIAISLNDIGVSMSTTEMKRELPVLIAETAIPNFAKEYKLTGHGNRRTKYGSILLNDYQSVLISAVQNITFDDFMVPVSAFADLHVEADVISSTVAFQRFASPSAVASLYNIILDDVAISEVANETFTDILPESLYQGTSTTFQTSTFGSSYTSYPLTYHQYVKQVPIVVSGTSTLEVTKEYKLTGHGNKRTKYGSILLEDYQSVLISAVANTAFDDFIIPISAFADMNVEADVISSTVAPQKFASAQNVAALYDVSLGDTIISEVAGISFTDIVPQAAYEGLSTTFETSTFGSSYTSYPRTFNKYAIESVPTVVSGTSTLEVVKEYKVGRHAITLKRWTDVLLSEFSSTPISVISDVVVGEYTVRPEDLADMHVDVSIAYSSVAAAKGSALNITSLYDVTLGDSTIADIGGSTFTGVVPQAAYEGLSTTFETSSFETLGFSFPRTYHEYVKQIPATNTQLDNLSVDREIVVRAEGHGFKYTLYNDELLSDYSSTPISTLSDIRFDLILDEVYDATVKMSPSPYAEGQAAKPISSDIFRNEIVLDIASSTDGHSLPYDGIPIEAIGNLAISATFYDRPLSEETLGTIFPTIYTKTNYVTYAKIAGTVSSANAEFSTLTISAFSSTPVSYLNNSLLSELAPIVIGSGTNFVSDFSLGSVFVANNEYFKVDSVANTTYMTTDRLPSSAFSGVVAYRISA